MTQHTIQRKFRVLTTAVATLMLGIAGTQSTYAGPAGEQDCPTAEIFATDNTSIITDPEDPRLDTRLTRFGREVREIIRAHGARPGASQLLDGVFWSGDLRQATYERSREFDVNRVGRDGLHHIAGVIAKEYHQEAVLTFRCLPRTSPETDAVEIEVPGVTPSGLRDALLADAEAREKLGGGSVTLEGRLLLIAPVADLPLARRFTAVLGADWDEAEVRYGDREFVS
ncbi:hypothetical protein [Streptomyces sp. NBC_00094]|uniref:hypothetical protein n=1 Tax=Streptomyces sp. NBC_00094 TaxID=2903620 RepID=UPI002257106C|nr:hypothetical protein [Streptomyces sp. NBC_00094]MCX5394832.1 hypothetical protein [Streptomyces sp. NBC_00094]